MFLFDTDILSNIIRPRPAQALLERLENLHRAVQFTSAINVGEIYFGACRSPKKNQILKAFTASVFPNLTVLPFDAQSGCVFGQLKAELEKAGTRCSEPDLRIAAITIQHHLTLVSGNVRHFTRIPGLKVENWLEA
ncbi:MAG: type II toxin-antitoxin system VapC family toxin [Desulfobacteraceae bacterium]|jgi:predicted nucleic acid-binding protein|nr:type II toxin-antitoxin system VapC family toxin [Desulfobacteraceae bacterium]